MLNGWWFDDDDDDIDLLLQHETKKMTIKSWVIVIYTRSQVKIN